MAHEFYLPSFNFVLRAGPDLGELPLPIERHLRALRQPMLHSFEEREVPPERRDRPIEPDVPPFVLAVRGLLEEERIAAARRMIDAAPVHVLSDPLVARLRFVLAPPVVTRVQKRDVDRTLEFAWLNTNGHAYRGRWVALVGNSLIGTASTLRELQDQLRTADFQAPPLLHRVD